MTANKYRNSSILLIDESPLQVLPSLAILIGLNQAIVLQQLHYLLQQSKDIYDGKKWVKNTYPEWREKEFPWWSIDTVKRIFLDLEKEELVLSETKYNPILIDNTKWYSIYYLKLEEKRKREEERKKEEKQREEKNSSGQVAPMSEASEAYDVQNCTTIGASCPSGQGKLHPCDEGKLPRQHYKREDFKTTTDDVVVSEQKIGLIQSLLPGYKLSGGVIEKLIKEKGFDHVKLVGEMIAYQLAQGGKPLTNATGCLRKLVLKGMERPPGFLSSAEKAVKEERKSEEQAREKQERDKIKRNSKPMPEEVKKFIRTL